MKKYGPIHARHLKKKSKSFRQLTTTLLDVAKLARSKLAAMAASKLIHRWKYMRMKAKFSAGNYWKNSQARRRFMLSLYSECRAKVQFLCLEASSFIQYQTIWTKKPFAAFEVFKNDCKPFKTDCVRKKLHCSLLIVQFIIQKNTACWKILHSRQFNQELTVVTLFLLFFHNYCD